MEKITVMVPIEVEISMHPSGRIRVHAATWPNFNVIEDQLQAIPKAECQANSKIQEQFLNILTTIDGWVIVQK